MLLIERKTGKTYKGAIEQLRQSEILKLEKHSSFEFDWSKTKDYEVFKIFRVGEEEILGLVAILDIPKELRVHLHLIEISKENRGKNKQIENLAACLFAFVCKQSFQKGYGGFVSLFPKTELITYYREQYGFQQIGNQMAIFSEASQSLIDKYL